MWKNSCYIVEQILPGSKWNPMDKSVNRRQNYYKIFLLHRHYIQVVVLVFVIVLVRENVLFIYTIEE